MRRSNKLTPLKESRDDLMATVDLQGQFSTSLQAMQRSLAAPMEQFPKTQIQNASLPTGGITQSAETSFEEGKAELEVLKAILNREGYLNRLQRSARTVNKKFKPEVADILDLVRAATLDVIESVVRWREAKRDHDAAFMWNQVNYMLKMPSDLDYLAQYLAIERHVGFGLKRNPFVVPSPMEDGVSLYKELIINPQGLTGGTPQDGFMIIGGISQARLDSTYQPSKGTMDATNTVERNDPTVTQSPYGRAPKKTQKELENEARKAVAKSNSFVMNTDMKKLRMAELVILKEEDKFGVWLRDPDNRLVPQQLANARTAAVELVKDDRRSVGKASLASKLHAPHADSSDIGVVQEKWVPDDAVKNKDKESKYLEKVDQDVVATKRGEGKFGGQLAPLATKGVETRIRKPLRTSVASTIEFARYRRKRLLGERLQEIDDLRQEINRQKLQLDEAKKGAMQRKREQAREISSAKGAARTGGSTSPMSRGRSVSSAGLGGTDRPKSVGFSATEPLPNIVDGAEEEVKAGSPSTNSPVGSPSQAQSRGSRSPSPTLGVGASDSISMDMEGIKAPGFDAPAPTDNQASEETPADKLTNEFTAIRETFVKYETGLDELKEEEKSLLRELEHIEADDDRMIGVKDEEQRATGVERSRDIERKRRHLTAKQGQRKGPPPAEAANAYDYYSIKCQATIRGWLARCFVKWFRQAARKACNIIQAGIRGKLGRLRVAKRRLEYFAQQQIAKIYRGFKARGVAAAAAGSKNVGKSALVLQKVWRGYLGRQRAKSKQALDVAANVARDAVDPRALLASDVRELGLRIQYAVEEPETSSFPPDEVLHLVRLCTVVIQQSRGLMGMSEYNFINARFHGEVDGETMTWKQASRFLNRAERMMRLVRSLAYGPGEKPPRLVQLSPKTLLLYSAQSNNPRWKKETFEEMGMGSKFASQLYMWSISIYEVSMRQAEFGAFLTSSFPDWLPKLYELQAIGRKAEADIESCTRCIDNIKELKLRNSDDKMLCKLLDTDIAEVNVEVVANEEILENLKKDEYELVHKQADRESFALVAMEEKLSEMNAFSDELTAEFNETNKLAQAGNTKAKEDLGQVRARLTEHQLSCKTLDGQFRLLDAQVSQNEQTRGEAHPLPIAVRVKAAACGEARAVEYCEIAKLKCYLEEQGVRHSEDLDPSGLDQFHVLDEYRREAHKSTYNLVKTTEIERRKFDKGLNDSLIENQKKEIASKDRVAPSDEEMEEERKEDEEQAVAERMKAIQFIPDAVIRHEHPKRPRPCIIALGRDLPEHCKNKILTEVTRIMPAVFVYLDCAENMGLDVREMQAVLDAQKCIIMMVDHGLARSSRLNFLKSFAVTIKALIPNPFVVMCVGDDKNCRTTANSHYGCAKQDIQLLRDCDIKVALEGMAWVVREITDVTMQKMAVQRSTLVESPSHEFVSVCEAIFCLIHGSEGGEIYAPEGTLKAMSWRFTAKTLADPVKMARKLRAVNRGKGSIKFIQILSEYVNGRYWPVPGSKERQVDPLMHVLALFVELFIQAEKCTLNRGGMPVQALSRGSMTGVQAVEVVTDSTDPEDMEAAEKSSGWRMTSAKLVRIALQDLRTMKCVMKINKVLLNVSAYREDQMVYFDTYNSSNSEVHLTQVPMVQIPFLLMPSQETVDTIGRPKPPQTKEELYGHLAKLLKFEAIQKSSSTSRRMLICRRNYTLLKKFQTKLGGHAAFVKCFEAALGQLYFSCWLPDSGAEVNFLLEERGRLDLLTCADPELEAQYVADDDARKLLNLATDRLKLSPSATMMRVAKNGEGFNKKAYRKKQGLLSDLRAQGFMLKVRTRKGPGKVMYRRVIQLSGVTHLLDVRMSSFTSMLIIRVYEPKKRHKMEYRMPFFLRKILLGTQSDDFVRWEHLLLKRLKINWRGEHSVYLDTVISRRVRRIHGKRLLVKMSIHDEQSVLVELVDNEISLNFEAIVNREQFVRILLYQHVGDVIKRDFGVEVQKDAVRNILNEMARGPTLQPGEVQENKAATKGAIDPILFDIPLMDILGHQEQVVWFSKQLELCLHRIKPNSDAYGYKMHHPVEVEFKPPPRPTNVAKMSTDLRFDSYFASTENIGDLQSVLTCRKQPAYRQMEDELNALALDLARAAAARAEEDKRAAEDFERKLLGLQSEAEKEEEEKAARAAQAAEEEWLRNREEERAIAAEAGVSEGKATEGEEANKPATSSRPQSAKSAKAFVPSDDFDLDNVIDEAAYLTADNLVQEIEEKNQKRLIERAQPGTTQDVRRLDIMAADGKSMVSVDAAKLTVEQRAILGLGERKVFEGGSKTTFRDTRASWSGHVAVTVYETLCWMGDDGLGKRLKFVVYEPGSAGTYTGWVNNLNHCTRILGKHGVDLLDPAKITEMILFIIKFRMRVADNSTTWDGVPNDEDADAYRIEFETVRVYDDDKITPVDKGGEEDAYANKDKLFEAEKKRGKKIVRLVRRVNGMLMQLTVFEVATTPESLLAIQDSKIASASMREEEEKAQAEADSADMGAFGDKGRAETRVSTTLKRHVPPTLKIIGYDPRSKKKATFIAPPAAILEVAGGIYSPYLEYPRRRELAKIACEALALNFPKGKPFELVMAWSGAAKETAGASLAKAPTKGGTTRSSAETILKRPGKLFRTAMVIGTLECVVTLYQQNAPGQKEENSAKGYVEKQLIVNVYARAASEATEIVISDQEQTERIGRTVASFPEGEMRAAGVRRLMRFLHAALIDDLDDGQVGKKIVHVVLRPPNKDFLTEYMQTKPTPPGEDIRPTGIPSVFLPLDTCGFFLYRCSMQLANKARGNSLSDYIVTVYSKSEKEGPERGLVIKIYERDTSINCILHLGPSETTRLLERVDEPELMRDLVIANNMATQEKLDEVEERFIAVTAKGELVNKAQQLTNQMVKIVLDDLAVTISPDQQLTPYLKSRGVHKLIQ